MILATIHDLPDRPTVEVLGVARGTSIRARHAGKNLLAWLRSLVGGEIGEMTKVIAEAREQATDRMIEDASRMGADAILGIRFTSAEVMSNAAEILVYGTAVRLEPAKKPSE
ncbi:MAG: YbjQ family protein [Planctomycetota bacterium]